MWSVQYRDTGYVFTSASQDILRTQTKGRTIPAVGRI